MGNEMPSLRVLAVAAAAILTGTVPAMGQQNRRTAAPGAPDERTVPARRFEPPGAALEIGDDGGRFGIGWHGNLIHLPKVSAR